MSISAQGLFNVKETVFRKDLKGFIEKSEDALLQEEGDARK